MNQTVKRIVDILFQDTVENEETNALHEELMNNCQEHFEDLTAHGMSEDEAIGAVVESLKGMKDVIDEYPKKKQPAETEENHTGAQPACDAGYSADGVKTLRIEATSNEVTVVTGTTDRILVHCDDPEAIRIENNNGTLRIVGVVRENDTHSNRSFFESKSTEGDSVEAFVSSILNKVRNALNKVTITINNFDDQPPIHVTVPENFAARTDISTRSGSICTDGIRSDSITLHTVSGDVRVGLPSDHTAASVDLNTTSGDVFMTGKALQMNVNTISGDLQIRGNFDTARLKTVSGDTDFDGSAGELTTNTVSGDNHIIAKNRDVREIRTESVSGDLYIRVPAEITTARTEIQTRSGERFCRFGDTRENILPRIIVKSVSGDVRVE